MKRMMMITALLAFCLSCGNVVMDAYKDRWGDEERAVYVSPGGSPDNSGLSPSSPKSTIVDGIAAAKDNGIGLVRISEGTYDISETITMEPGVSLQGGWNTEFSSRNWTVYKTIISNTSIRILFVVNNPEIKGDVYEGLFIDMQLSPADNHLIVFSLSNKASPVIQDNDIYIRYHYSDEWVIYGILFGDYGDEADADIVIRRNIIRLHRSNSQSPDRGARAIHFGTSRGAGAKVTIEQNRITAHSNFWANGIRILTSNYMDIIVKNNIITCYGNTGRAIYLRYTMTGAIVIANNTLYGNSNGIYLDTDSTINSLKIINNIIHSSSATTGTVNSATVTDFEFKNNLTFGFSTHVTGFTPDGTNAYNASNSIFGNVFVDSSMDSTLTDGDDTDYHIHAGDSTWAYNMGMDASGEAYGSVTNDFDGLTRPRGGLYDRGAFER